MLQYGGLVAVYTVADLGRCWQRRSVLGLILATFPPAALLITHNTAAEFMFTLLLPLAAYLLGSLARTERARLAALADRAAELERGREADAARAAAEERNRIARDMHDVLAHAVCVMVVQAEAGPVALATDPDRAAHNFDIIAEAGRAAMVQLSDMLGILNGRREVGSAAHRTPVPEPTLAAIPSLVASTRRAGLRVELRIDGSPRPLAADAEVAGYRIVQEAYSLWPRWRGGYRRTGRPGPCRSNRSGRPAAASPLRGGPAGLLRESGRRNLHRSRGPHLLHHGGEVVGSEDSFAAARTGGETLSRSHGRLGARAPPAGSPPARDPGSRRSRAV